MNRCFAVYWLLILAAALGAAGGVIPWPIYLVTALALASLSIGAILLFACYHLTGGEWFAAIEAHAKLLLSAAFLAALAMFPVFACLEQIYPWARPPLSPEVEKIRSYLNQPFFIARGLLYLSTLSLLAFRFKAAESRQRKLGAAACVAVFVFGTFAAFDWIMSLSPGWHSTVFGAYYIIGGVCIAFCTAVCLTLAANRRLSRKFYNDWGKLLLSLVLLWTYLGFSQYLIIWSGNLPSEVVFYLERTAGGWWWASAALILLHFILPVLLLLSRRSRESRAALLLASISVVSAGVLDIAWLVLPSFPV